MKAGEKIFYAKEKWKCSFEELAFLLEMDKPLVMALYYQEKRLRLPKITIDSDLKDVDISERTRNILRRRGIITIKDLITYTGQFDTIRGCGKQSLQEILELITTVQSVLNLKIYELIAAFGAGTVLDFTFMNRNGKQTDTLVRWEIKGVKVEPVLSITGRLKGQLRRVQVNAWLQDQPC